MKFKPNQHVLFKTTKGWVQGYISHIVYENNSTEAFYCIRRKPDKRRFHKDTDEIQLNRNYYLNLI
jgi:hypothetical protein